MGAPDVALLHVYGQAGPHDEVFVVGNRKALEGLRDALSRAIEASWPPAITECEAMACDGEGFTTVVILEDGPWVVGSRWRRMVLPYAVGFMEDVAEDAVIPWKPDWLGVTDE
jgi:hypothetical protein